MKNDLDIDIPKDFIRFLKENGILVKFKQASEKEYEKYFKTKAKIDRFDLKKMRYLGNPNTIAHTNYVNRAFKWGDTTDGECFWGEISHKWKKHCLENYPKNDLIKSLINYDMENIKLFIKFNNKW